MVTTLYNRRLAHPTLPVAIHAEKLYPPFQTLLHGHAERVLEYGRQPPERSSSGQWHHWHV